MENVKQQCTLIASGPIEKLECQFPTQENMNVIGVIYVNFGCNLMLPHIWAFGKLIIVLERMWDWVRCLSCTTSWWKVNGLANIVFQVDYVG